MYSEIATGNVTKIQINYRIFLLVCFILIYSEIATGNVTKIKRNSKVFLLVFFTQIYSETATGNVTKIKEKIEYSYWLLSPKSTPKLPLEINKNSEKF